MAEYEFIPVNEPDLGGNEKKYITECIDNGWISSEGPAVIQFEEKMAECTGRKYAAAVCNGTAALELAVAALELEPGDEVIIPAFTIISCAAAVIRRGCVPVLVDCDASTWNMDVSRIEAKITRKTKALMMVHIYGLPVDVQPLLELASKYGLKVIEDAAEMHGQTYRGKACGSFGDISIFSFYPNKHITTGEGGMVLTDDSRLAERCRSLRNLCFIPEKRFVHDELGYNFRMTSLQAALGLAQLEQLDKAVRKKRKIGSVYTRLLSGVPGLQLPVAETDYARNIYWVYGIVLGEEIPFEADVMMQQLKGYEIGTRPFFWPMHEQPVFRKMGLFAGESYPNAERIARRGFYLPSGLTLKKGQMERVAQAVGKIVEDSRV